MRKKYRAVHKPIICDSVMGEGHSNGQFRQANPTHYFNWNNTDIDNGHTILGVTGVCDYRGLFHRT